MPAQNPLSLTGTEIRQLLIQANCPLVEGDAREYLVQITERAVIDKLRQSGEPVADERTAFKLLDAWQAVCDRIVDQYGGVVAGVDFAALGRANRAALASAPVAGEAQAAGITSRRLSGVLSMDGASLHIQPDGSGQIVVAEDDFTLEDDRSEGPDGPQGSVYWVARLPTSELAALRDFLTGHARPSDDALWDLTLAERDECHDMADKLANAIADHLLVEIGEHSSSNCPWMRALEAIENAAPQVTPAPPSWPTASNAMPREEDLNE